MRNEMLILVAALAGACSTQTKPDEGDAMTARNSVGASQTESLSSADAKFVAAYEAGDAAAAAAHYANDAIWYLTNGMPISGRAAIAGFLAKAQSDGAGQFDFSGRAVREVGEYRYAQQAFAFDLAPGKTVAGTRYSVWHQSEVLRDAWVSTQPASDEVVAEVKQATTALAAAYNGGGAGALAAAYADDASIVLSNGTVVASDGLPKWLMETAAMGITDMRFGPQTIYAAGPEHAYALGEFDVTLPLPGGPVALEGERLLLWRNTDAGWRAVLELSWPRTVPTTTANHKTVEAEGVKFSWRFQDDRLFATLEGPSSGWVAVGFNDAESLAGSRLIMARVGETAVVEEHFADPPNHREIGVLGAPQTVFGARSKAVGNTAVEFELATGAVPPSNLALIQGEQYWLTLAFSDHADFDHHSRFRTARLTLL